MSNKSAFEVLERYIDAKLRVALESRQEGKDGHPERPSRDSLAELMEAEQEMRRAFSHFGIVT